MMNRPTRKFKVGDKVGSAYHDEHGEVLEVDWTCTFGCWTYLLLRSRTSRYGGEKGTKVWVCETDLKVEV